MAMNPFSMEALARAAGLPRAESFDKPWTDLDMDESERYGDPGDEETYEAEEWANG